MSQQQSNESFSLLVLQTNFQKAVLDRVKTVQTTTQYLQLLNWVQKIYVDEKKRQEALEIIRQIPSIPDDFKYLLEDIAEYWMNKKIVQERKMQHNHFNLQREKQKMVSKNKDIPEIEKEKVLFKNKDFSNIDLDSVSCFLRVQGLTKLMGIRASLASSTQYLIDKDIIGDYCNILDGQFIVKIPFVKKQMFGKKLFQHEIQYSPSQPQEQRICTQKVWVSMSQICAILNQIGVKYVRVIGHGLKQFNITCIDWKQYLVSDSTNRFDFALMIKSNYFNLYTSFLGYQVEIFPLFGTNAGTLKFQKEGRKVKIYNTIIHALKHRAKFQWRIISKINFAQLRRIIQKIYCYRKSLQINIPSATRIQITIHQQFGKSFEQIEEIAIKQLLQIKDNLQPSQMMTKKQYVSQIDECLKQSEKGKYFKGNDKQKITREANYQLIYLLKLLGISQRSRKTNGCQQKKKIIQKRDKKGRFIKKNKDL